MHIKAKILFFTKSGEARVSPGNSSLFLILISQHFEFGTAEIASHILRASSDKVNILVAPCRLLASHTYARTRESFGDTPRSTSSKNVLKANTCILRRLGYPPPPRTPPHPSFHPAAHMSMYSGTREKILVPSFVPLCFISSFRYIRQLSQVHTRVRSIAALAIAAGIYLEITGDDVNILKML